MANHDVRGKEAKSVLIVLESDAHAVLGNRRKHEVTAQLTPA